ncbi:MAG: sigma-70 family RNA polymerase sigma factor [Anaerolineae bacterium]|jgi:RNA polymerase sigma-70 factor (ECF subfamily)
MERSTDVQLVHRAQRGDEAAFAELFTRYEGPIFGYLYRMVGDRAWAEDLAQEAFIRAYQHLGKLGPPYDFKSWTYRIASNLALDGLRRHRDTVPLPDWDAGQPTAPEPSVQQPGPEDQTRLSEVRSAIWHTLHQLSDRYREILILREIESLSYKEIAAALGLSMSSVKVTLHRARLQFRDLYGLRMMVESGRMECQELNELLSAEVDGELDAATRQRVKAHIENCSICQETRRDLLAVSSLLGMLAPVFPPPTLRPRFLKRLQHMPRPEPPAETPPDKNSPPDRATTPQAPKQGGFPWLAVAAGLGGAALLGGFAIALLLLLPKAGVAPPPSPTPTSTPISAIPTATPPSASTATASPPTRSPTVTPAPPTDTPIPPSATPIPPTLTPSPPPPTIAFWADATTIQAGSCTVIHWETANVGAVRYDGADVPGTGSDQVCLCSDESHTLDVERRDGSHDVRTITIQVTGSCVTPTPTATPDSQPPPAPQNLQPSGDTILRCRSQVTLTWDPVQDPAGLAGYTMRLETDVTGTWEPAGRWGPVEGTEIDVIVSCGYGYRWTVRAEDGAGNVGPWSVWALFGVGID